VTASSDPLGPSGCGKSTTCWRPSAGSTARRQHPVGETVFYDGERTYLPPERRKGLVFQSYALWPHMSVAENRAYP
jgi:iron(III) transport system ATP-binding protein